MTNPIGPPNNPVTPIKSNQVLNNEQGQKKQIASVSTGMVNQSTEQTNLHLRSIVRLQLTSDKVLVFGAEPNSEVVSKSVRSAKAELQQKMKKVEDSTNLSVNENLELVRHGILSNDRIKILESIKIITSYENRGAASPSILYLKAEAYWLLDDFNNAIKAYAQAIAGESDRKSNGDLPADVSDFDHLYRPFEYAYENDPSFAHNWGMISDAAKNSIFKALKDNVTLGREGLSDEKVQYYIGIITHLFAVLQDKQKSILLPGKESLIADFVMKGALSGEDQLFGDFMTSVTTLYERLENNAVFSDSLGCLLKMGTNKPNLIKFLNFVELYNNVLSTKSYPVRVRLVEKLHKNILHLQTLNSSELQSAFLDRLQSTIYTFQKLSDQYPVLLPRFLEVFETAQDDLSTLYQLHKNLSPEQFEHFVRKYVAIEKLPWESSGNQILVPELWKVLAFPQRIEKLKTLIQIEMQEKVVMIPFFLKDPKRLDEAIAKAVTSNLFDPKYFFHESVTKQPYDYVLQRVHFNGPLLWNIYKIAEGFPSAILKFSNDVFLWGKTQEPTAVSKLYSVISHSQQDPAQIPKTEALLSMIEHGDEENAWKICVLPQRDGDFKNKLFSLIRLNEYELVNELLKLHLTLPKDHFAKVVLAKASESNATQLLALIRLKKQGHELSKVVLESENTTEFTPLLQAALKLEAQGEGTLVNFCIQQFQNPRKVNTLQEKYLRQFILEGRIGLAHDLLDLENSQFWKIIWSEPALSTDSIQQLRDLRHSMDNQDARHASWTTPVVESIMDIALLLSAKSPAKASLWISNIQFYMVHDPDKIAKEFQDGYWSNYSKIIREGGPQMQSVVETISKSDFCHEIDPNKIFNYIGNISNSPMSISLAISNMFTTIGGSINRPIIDVLLKDPDLFELDNLDLRALAAFKDDRYFEERLSAVKSPPKNSRQEKRVQLALEFPDRMISKRGIQTAIQGTLLVSIRQRAGSCFGTSTVIQTASTMEGLKQTLEDSLALINDGYLTRKNHATNATIQYPMALNLQNHSSISGNDHLLSRIREDTIASMGIADVNWRDNVVEQLRKLIEPELDRLYHSSNPDLQELLKSIKNKTEANQSGGLGVELLKVIKSSMVERYFGGIKFNVKTGNKIGGWVLTDIHTNEVIGESRESLQKFMLQAISTYLKKVEGMLDEKEKKAFKAFMQGPFASFIEKGAFYAEALKANFIGNYHLSNMTPSTLVTNVGGLDISVIEKYYGVKPSLKAMPIRTNPLMSVIAYVRKMSEFEQAEVIYNPNQLKVLHVKHHSMNLKLGQIFEWLGSGIKSEEYVKEQARANKSLMDTPMTLALQQELIKGFAMSCPANIWKLIDPELSAQLEKNRPKTLQELCRVIIAITAYQTGLESDSQIVRTCLLRAINEIDELVLKVPKNLSLVDTNWPETNTDISFGAVIDGDVAESFYVDDDGQPSVISDVPWRVATWTIPEFPNRLDDFTRSYYIAKIE